LNNIQTKKDFIFMKLALEEAKLAFSKKEVPVGAILVKDDKIISRSHNQSISKNDPSGHAEMNVLREAAKKTNNYRLNGTSLYVTLEPCLMCFGACIHARIDRLIFATYYGESSDIQYVTVSTTGNAADFGSTTITTSAHSFYCGAAANATRCVIQSGGYVGGGASNIIEYVTMSTLGNATDFGDQVNNEEQSHQVCTSGNPS